MQEIDPDNLGSFQIPADVLDKLYEFTGGSSDQSKGFILAYTDQKGDPMVYCRAGTQIIDMGIRKALEKYLIEIESVDSPYDMGEDQ
tara:strand:- start:3099 stop:3359 length:261 start_codon:yes stop_codon:yes gene_type:complete